MQAEGCASPAKTLLQKMFLSADGHSMSHTHATHPATEHHATEHAVHLTKKTYRDMLQQYVYIVNRHYVFYLTTVSNHQRTNDIAQ